MIPFEAGPDFESRLEMVNGLLSISLAVIYIQEWSWLDRPNILRLPLVKVESWGTRPLPRGQADFHHPTQGRT